MTCTVTWVSVKEDTLLLKEILASCPQKTSKDSEDIVWPPLMQDRWASDEKESQKPEVQVTNIQAINRAMERAASSATCRLLSSPQPWE